MAKQCPRIRGVALCWPIYPKLTRASLPRHSSSSSAPAKSPAAESHLEKLWNACSFSFVPPIVRRASRSRNETNAGGNFAIVGQPDDPSSDLLRSNEFFLKGQPRRVHLYSAAKLQDHPMNTIIPEIIVFGMSNAGKSTFINTILNQSVAKAGKKPGKTRLLHAYAAGPPLPFSYGTRLHAREKAPQHSLVLIDTPGYGYNSRGDWGKHVADYLRKRSALRGALILIRGYTGIKDADRMLLEQLSRLNVPTQLIFTRMDEKVTNIGDSLQIWKDAADAVAGCEVNHPEWRRGVGWMDSLLFTAAGFNATATLRASTGMGMSPGRTGNAGIMGARAAILSLAGLLNDESFVAAQLKREAIMRDTKIDRLASQKPKIAPHNPLADSRDEEDLDVETTDAAMVTGSLKSNATEHAAWSGEMVSFEEMERMVQKTKPR